MADEKDKSVNKLDMAAGGVADAKAGSKPDTVLQAALKKIQGNEDYRVLTKADYESLVSLAKKSIFKPLLLQLWVQGHL